MDFPPLTFGGDFLGGFQDETANIRKSNDQKQAAIDQRNSKVFETLANSDDPDIRAAAVTGLLTGNHPSKGMDKWFGKVQDHPIYDTIKGLVSEGHQPFMDPAQRHATELGNDIDARVSSVGRSGLSPDDQRRAKLGIYGAPPPRPLPLQEGTLHKKDGTTVAGFFDPAEGVHYDSNYQPVYDAVSFTRNGTGGGSTSAGHTSKVVPDKNSPTGYSTVRYDDKMQEIGRALGASAPGGPETFTAVPTAGGIQRFGNHSGSISPAGGGAGVTRAEPPTADLNALREVESSILRLHPQPKPVFSGGQVSPEKQQAWRAAVDAEAKNYDFSDFAALQKALGGAAGGVDAATPPPQVPPGLGAKPTPKSPKGQANTGKGKIDVNAILGELAKARKGVADSAGAPAPK